MPSLTSASTQFRGEAGAVCLDSQYHGVRCQLSVAGCFEETFGLSRPRVTDEMRRSHNDQEKATEHGAEGVAFLLALKLTPYRVIEQSRRGTCIDWWLGFRGKLFQHAGRLECSGLRAGTAGQLEARTLEKVARARRANSTLPTYVCVVNFKPPCVKMGQL